MGSEPGAGWVFSKAWHSITPSVLVITREKNLGYGDEVPPGLNLLGFDLHPVLVYLKKALPFGTQVYAALWNLAVRRFIATNNENLSARVYHHVTFGSDWLPLAIPRKLAEKTVWGPVGGFTRPSSAFARWMGARGFISFCFRVVVTEFLRRLNRLMNSPNVARILANNPETEKHLKSLGYLNVSVEHHAYVEGLSESRLNGKTRNPVTMVGIGRLVPWKGWTAAVRVISLLPSPFSLVIFGSGRDRKRLQRLIRKLGVETRVTLAGSVPRAKVIHELSFARCLIHPSLHDSSPFAVAEAISLGTPVVGFDLYGTGHLIKMSGMTPAQFVGKFSHQTLADQVLASTAPSFGDSVAIPRLVEVLRRLSTELV